jgi:hypothetical protein
MTPGGSATLHTAVPVSRIGGIRELLGDLVSLALLIIVAVVGCLICLLAAVLTCQPVKAMARAVFILSLVPLGFVLGALQLVTWPLMALQYALGHGVGIGQAFREAPLLLEVNLDAYDEPRRRRATWPFRALFGLFSAVRELLENPFGRPDEEWLGDLHEMLQEPRYARHLNMDHVDQIIAAGDGRAARRLILKVSEKAHPEAFAGERSFGW